MSNSDKILLILDLDETLIHSTLKPLARPHDFRLFHYYVHKRPYLTDFLEGISNHFELAVWSSSTDDYCEEITRMIFPDHTKLKFVWARSRCRPTLDFNADMNHSPHYLQNYEYIKKLQKIKRSLGFRMERMLIVDDTPLKAKHNYGNAIYINEYKGEEGEEGDEELKLLLRYLVSISDAKNVREIEKRDWRLGLKNSLHPLKV